MRGDFINSRIKLIGLFFAFFAAAIFARAVYLQVFDNSRLTIYADKQNREVLETPGIRGNIYDCKGRELAISIVLPSVYAETGKVKDKEDAAEKLSRELPESRESILAKLNSGKSFVWLGRKIQDEAGRNIKSMKLPGITMVRESKRVYPRGRLLAHVLGAVSTDNKGLEGVELSMNDRLSGENGRVEAVKDAKGRIISSDDIVTKPAKDGDSIYLTIDEMIQYVTEKELDRTCQDFKAKGAVAVVMNTATGEILSMAVRPGYDPNDLKSANQASMKNQAVASAYEPGSIFKIVALAAGLSEKVTNESEVIYCENGKWEVYKRNINDHIKYGNLTFRQIIELSSNIGTAKIGQRLGPDRFYAYARSFGFGEKTGVQLAGEVRGTLREPANWSGISSYIVPIGQEIAATPMQLICALNVVANEGKLLKPVLVKSVMDCENKLVQENTSKQVRQVVDPLIAKRMVSVLKGVVEEGTGKEAVVEGYSAAGKTGTAQKFDNATRKYSSDKYVSSFMGFVPADKPKIAILVSIDEPNKVYWGGSVAAPCFSRIAKQTLRYLEKEHYDLVKNN